MKIKIDAIDTLFFKDGKPFSMGEETWADGIFPAPPSVFYGALRSTYFGIHPNEFKLANTPKDPTKNLIINHISFSYSGVEYFTIPLDYAKKKNEKGNIAYRMVPSRKIELSSSSLVDSFLKLTETEKKEEVESVNDSIITQSSLIRYLKGEEKKVVYKKLNDVVLSEAKVGIGRDNFLHTTEESKLYRVGLKRLSEKKDFGKEINSLSFIVEFEGIELPEKGLLKFGAEGKVVKYQVIENKFQVFTSEEISKITDQIFLIYLATPALFANGWLPDFKNNELLNRLEIELITASLGKFISIGGFDMAQKIPKPMLRAVPSGSIYIVKSISKNFEEIYNTLNGKSISDSKSNEGYGICYIGRVI